MKVWIYLDGRQQGPFEMEELLDMPVNENTKVWFEGLPKWYPAGYLSEMRPLFDGTLVRTGVPAEPGLHTPPPTPRDALITETIVETCAEEETVAEEPAYGTREFPPAAAAAATAPLQPCPPSYLVWGIVLTICCCSPIAIGVIIASICVGNYYARGNYAAAQRASEWAQWLIMASLALGLLPLWYLAALL